MPKLIRDTGEACRPYSLNLPESYAALFAKITNNGSSNACRLLINYALEHGALEALAAKPQVAPLPGPSQEPDWAATWNNEE